MWSQVCLGRQVNHHVYLRPVLGTDQTFAFPASPWFAPFSLSFSLPPYAGLPERQHAVKQRARQSKFAKEKGAGWKIPLKSLCVAELFHVWVQNRFSNRSLTCSSWSSVCAFLCDVSLWNTESISYSIFVQLYAHGFTFSSIISTFPARVKCFVLFVTILCIFLY